FLLIFFVSRVDAQSCTDIANASERIGCLEGQISKLQVQSKSLSNQIAQFDAQIKLTTFKISQAEEKIELLGGRIDQLEDSLTSLETAFSSRARETYKMARFENNFFFIFAADDVSEAVSRFHYLEKVQEADSDLFNRLQNAQTTYKGEKTDQENLQTELLEQKTILDKQKKEKANLLSVTKNDEKKYQQLLSIAKAELAVVFGGGKETFMRDVSEGEKIGSIITGSSGCSSGTHLHFEVHQGSSIQDPNNYLRGISFSYDYGPDQYSYYGTINPHGSWNWPLNEPISINQAYGSHSYAKTFYSGGIHTGIDMDSGSGNNVKAVKAGKLYGGSYSCGGAYPGTLLYAKIDHGDGMTTWYLHILPQ
ncbi:MAG: murein hydrolase activator EnvC family protein, partial [Microgenomates group bacterium]